MVLTSDLMKLVLIVLVLTCLQDGKVQADPVLRYNLNSCTSLEPSLVNENWAYPGGGEKQWLDEALFSSPRRSRDRSPPFSIQIEFNQYRRDREYQGEDEDSLTFSHSLSVRIEAAEYYDSFLLQTRGKDQPDGNATLIGWFVSIPNICKDLHCYDKSKSSVVDKGRPIKLGNLTFTWRSPATDYGAIKFVASIVVGQEYHVIESNQISFNNFPVSIKGCGREMSCFRSCSTSPICDPEDSDTMAVMYLTGDKRNIVVSLGGVVQDENVITVAVRIEIAKHFLTSRCTLPWALVMTRKI